MSLTVAVTRPEPQATATAARLSAQGDRPFLAPLMRARPRSDWGSAERIGALAITSQTAARLLADRGGFHGIPAFCVGRTTADVARRSGMRDVRAADGTVEALLALILDDAEGPIVHLAGRDHTGDLVENLLAAGCDAERRLVYRMDAAQALPPAPTSLDAVLLYSPRTARLFTEHLRTASPVWCNAPCVALSSAVAASLGEQRALVAERPDEDALFRALECLRP